MASIVALLVKGPIALLEVTAAMFRALLGQVPVSQLPQPLNHLLRYLSRRYHGLRVWSAILRRSILSHITFIAVTGSSGKTTTTRLIGAVLSSGSDCRISAGDNLIRSSVKTILSVDPSKKFCVQEIGTDRRGMISRHVRILRPRIGVITTIGTDHYKQFRSLEATAREKSTLVENLPRHGIAILNADDPYVRAMAARTHARVIMIGRSPDADVRATDVSSVWPDRLRLTVTHGQQSARVETQLVGEHWTTSVLAAIACGIACKLDLETCAKAIHEVKPTFNRFSVHPKPNGAVYVLDTYNAALTTISSSLAFLATARAPRKTIVFGTISDYPGASSPRYRRIAREALDVADRVIFVGPNSTFVNKLRREEMRDRLFAFQTSYQANAFLTEDVVPEELIYLKASLADHLERIMLSQFRQMRCWRERCGVRKECCYCRHRRRPHLPFGLPTESSGAA